MRARFKGNAKNIIRFDSKKQCFCEIQGFHKLFRKSEFTNLDGKKYFFVQYTICSSIEAKKDRKNNPFTWLMSYSKNRKFEFTLRFNDFLDLYSKQNGKCNLT
tara:strand:+ start:229 stop:537 length:309 start_codon:yes stop_codon:yes gene_type:complete